jgi:hypothetical protein
LAGRTSAFDARRTLGFTLAGVAVIVLAIAGFLYAMSRRRA